MSTQQKLIIFVMFTVILIIAASCSQLNSPENVAQEFVEEQLTSNRIPYRNEIYITDLNDGTYATVRVNLELKADSSSKWEEKETSIELVKINDEWMVDTNYLKFETPRAYVQQTQVVINSIAAEKTATAEKEEEARQSALSDFFNQHGTEIENLVENALNVLLKGYTKSDFSDIWDYYSRDAILKTECGDTVPISDVTPPFPDVEDMNYTYCLELFETDYYKINREMFHEPEILNNNKVKVEVFYQAKGNEIDIDVPYFNLEISNERKPYGIWMDRFTADDKNVCFLIENKDGMWKISIMNIGCNLLNFNP